MLQVMASFHAKSSGESFSFWKDVQKYIVSKILPCPSRRKHMRSTKLQQPNQTNKRHWEVATENGYILPKVSTRGLSPYTRQVSSKAVAKLLLRTKNCLVFCREQSIKKETVENSAPKEKKL